MTRLNWGMIGGGEGSQIGPAHRLAARLDGEFEFVAGALDENPNAGRTFAQSLDIAADRAYGVWPEMLEAETAREDPLDLVTVGPAEGMPMAFANIYADLATMIRAARAGTPPDPAATHYPTAEDGLRSMAAVYAAVDSASQAGDWIDARPRLLR